MFVCLFFTLFSAHTFLILILQTASYKTHACWLTLITGGCGVIWSTLVLHTMLNRPGTRSNRVGPDPDAANHLKYSPEPIWFPGPPWSPLPRMPMHKSGPAHDPMTARTSWPLREEWQMEKRTQTQPLYGSKRLILHWESRKVNVAVMKSKERQIKS